MTKKTYRAIRTDRLWGALRVVAWIYIAASLAFAGLLAFRIHAIANLDAGPHLINLEPIPGHEWEVWAVLGVSLVFLAALLVGAILTLIWYLRSVRNARALGLGMETSPAWVVWFFIIPVISLWKPYSATSELWRSSFQPERWRGLRDPALLRWWWGAVLTGGILSNVGGRISESARVTRDLAIGDGISAAALLILAVAGLLFLRIGGPISRSQTALIESGWTRPGSSTPSWGA